MRAPILAAGRASRLQQAEPEQRPWMEIDLPTDVEKATVEVLPATAAARGAASMKDTNP